MEALLDPLNPSMDLVWSFAYNSGPIIKRNKKQQKEVGGVDVYKISDSLIRLSQGHRRHLNSQTFHRASMVMSGIMRLHKAQTDYLLDDTKKLLETMRREKKYMEHHEKQDYTLSHAKVVEPAVLELFDQPAVPHDTVLAKSTVPAAARPHQLNWNALDGDIEWADGLQQADIRQITLPDADVAPSKAYEAEMERLRRLAGSFEGPTLLEWEEQTSRETSPRPDQITEESIVEAPLHTLVPSETEERTVPTIVVEEAEPSALPVLEEEPEPPAPTVIPPTPEELPSQLELAPLEKGQAKRQARRGRKVQPLIDTTTYLPNDIIRTQIQTSQDTMRVQRSEEDIIDIEEVRHRHRDLFEPRPPHRKTIPDALLHLFAPCEGEAPLAIPESSFLEIARATSHIEERDLSSLPSILQDTSSSLVRSRSTLIEPPTGLFEEAHPLPLESIQEHEVPALAGPTLLPEGDFPPPEIDMPLPGDAPLLTETKLQRPKPTRKGKGADAARRESPQLEESTKLSESLELSLSEPDEGMVKRVLEMMELQQEATFNELLSPDPTDYDAAFLFENLMQMYKDGKVRLQQDCAFGPITICLPRAA